ncbi:MAG: hypothetical protein QXK37_05540 [Candidatus Woesearchaeota archaeon]
MNQREISIVLISIGFLLAIFVYYLKIEQEKHINLIVDKTGTCFLEDGTCLHEQSNTMYIIGWVFSGIITFFGVFLFFDKTQKMLAEQQIKISAALKDAVEKDKQKDEFSAYLSAFSSEEQMVIKAIHEQEGILQSTLRYRTGMSKAGLSILLKSLEERGIVSKKPKGKTNQLFLRKRF